MSVRTDTVYRPSWSDAVGIVVSILAGSAIAITSLVLAIGRIVDVLSPGPFDVPVEFVDLTVDAPLGRGGAPVPLAIDSGSVSMSVSELPGASVFAAVAEPVTYALTVTVVVVCLVLLNRNFLRGRIFSKGNTRLVMILGVVCLVGFNQARFFGNMVANGAIARLSDNEFSGNAIMSSDLSAVLLTGFAWATAFVAFTAGARFQRDTEGLV